MVDTPGTWGVRPASGTGTVQAVVMIDDLGNRIPQFAPRVNDGPVSDTNPFPVVLTNGGVDLTAAAGDAHQVVTGGTAVTAFAASSMTTGGMIVNPPNASASLFVDPVNVPGTTAPGTNGTTIELLPGREWRAPGPLSGAVMVNSSDSAHAFTAIRF